MKGTIFNFAITVLFIFEVYNPIILCNKQHIIWMKFTYFFTLEEFFIRY